MKRIANYRAGDRAESLGVVLLQLFSAVTTVPRQEDFGIFDAIATLLRRDGRLLYAEDSFLVQFKARTERKVTYLDDRLNALLNQELALFIGHVDITTASINLFSVGAALAHPNIRDMKGLVVYVDSVKQRFDDGVLHTSLGAPVLQWSSAKLSDEAFERRSSEVMRAWLEWDRWNRRFRRMGMQSQVQWTTNEIPSRTWTSAIWNPERAKESLSELVPAIQMIAMHANSDEAIAEPVLQLIDWLRRRGIEPDPAGVHGLFVAMSLGRVQISRALDENPPAEFAVRFFDIRSTPSGFHFWMQAGNRDGLADAESHDGPADELRARGFDVEVGPETGQISRIELGQKLLAQRSWEVVGRANGVILLRKPQLDPTSTKGGSGTSPAPRSEEHRAI